MADIDTERIRSEWALLRAKGDVVPRRFYVKLNQIEPETREMFPIEMGLQRRKVMEAIGDVVVNIDNLAAVVPVLERLGRDHRRFGVEARHYPAVGRALLATGGEFLGEGWDTVSWTNAYDTIAEVMMSAAQEASDAGIPAWWNAWVVDVERPQLDVAEIQLAVVGPEGHPYRLGDAKAVPANRHGVPGGWRTLPVCPDSDGSLQLSVAIVEDDYFQTAMVVRTVVGDSYRIGAPFDVPALQEAWS